jgi:hypothetical protein
MGWRIKRHDGSHRGLSKPLQSWQLNGMAVATELALAFVEREAWVMPFLLQDTTCDPTAGAVLEVRSLGARLTASQAQLLLTDSTDLCTLGAHPLASTHCGGR